MNDNEKFNQSPENSTEAQNESTSGHSDRLRARYEKIDESRNENGENGAEKARTEALEKAISSERTEAKAIVTEKTVDRRGGSVSKAEKRASYNRTMKEVQSEMSAPSRAFSKVIHNRAVETTSELAGKTIARPNAVLAGSLTAFVLTFAVYMIAKSLGYPLSGLETICAFALGWILGLLFDYFKILITGKK